MTTWRRKAVNLLTEDTHRKSAAVSSDASIIDIRLRNLTCNLLHPGARLPLELSDFRITPVMVPVRDSIVAYHVSYDLSAGDADGRKALEIRLTMSVVFSLGHDSSTREDLEAFGYIGVLDILHPYMRETVHNLTSRMGFPPLVLDVKPTPWVDVAP